MQRRSAHLCSEAPPGLGWTLNFARPLALPFLGFILAVVYGVLELSRSFGTSGGAHLAISLLLALGLIALCYRLSIPKPDFAPSDDAAAKLRQETDT